MSDAASKDLADVADDAAAAAATVKDAAAISMFFRAVFARDLPATSNILLSIVDEESTQQSPQGMETRRRVLAECRLDPQTFRDLIKPAGGAK